jgi:hypothetical protein
MDRQKALETINAALQDIRLLKEAINADKSLVADIESRLLLNEVRSLLQMLEDESGAVDE